jgi:hypothetical protein
MNNDSDEDDLLKNLFEIIKHIAVFAFEISIIIIIIKKLWLV